MASVRSLLKTGSAFMVATSLFVMSTVAEGVTPAAAGETEQAGDGLSAGIVSRADADIQIRRIKTMMATKKTDTDKDIEQLEKLQKILHGQN
jgi:hypothetical protein